MNRAWRLSAVVGSSPVSGQRLAGGRSGLCELQSPLFCKGLSPCVFAVEAPAHSPRPGGIAVDVVSGERRQRLAIHGQRHRVVHLRVEATGCESAGKVTPGRHRKGPLAGDLRNVQLVRVRCACTGSGNRSAQRFGSSRSKPRADSSVNKRREPERRTNRNEPRRRPSLLLSVVGLGRRAGSCYPAHCGRSSSWSTSEVHGSARQRDGLRGRCVKGDHSSQKS